MFDVVALYMAVHIRCEQDFSLCVFVEIADVNQTVVDLMLLKVKNFVDSIVSETKGGEVG